MERKYDFIIYGATGFTAGHIIRNLKRENVKLALAARNIEALRDIKCPIYKCEISELHKIAAKAKILINCVGPFTFTGESIVEECLKAGTHYMDISGEPYFLEFIINKYHDIARKKGIYIINCCGYDAVPADIGAMYLKSYFDSVQIEGIAKTKNLVVHTTSFESMLIIAQNMDACKSLHENRYGKIKHRRMQRFGMFSHTYQVLFRGTDFFIIRRTWALMNSVGLGDGGVSYTAYLDVGSKMNLLRYYFTFIVMLMFCNSAIGRWFLRKIRDFITYNMIKERPSNEELARGQVRLTLKSMGEKDGRILNKTLIITGPDPGYGTTALCAVQVAVTFLECLNERHEGTSVTLFTGGVITPACALYNTNIVQRLISKGLKFELVDD